MGPKKNWQSALGVHGRPRPDRAACALGPPPPPVAERRAEYPGRAALVARSRADAWGMLYDVRREAGARWPGPEPAALLGGADPPDRVERSAHPACVEIRFPG